MKEATILIDEPKNCPFRSFHRRPKRHLCQKLTQKYQSEAKCSNDEQFPPDCPLEEIEL
jgi:hypothetical protein